MRALYRPLLLPAVLLTCCIGVQAADDAIAADTYRMLDRVRETKRAQLTAYLERLRSLGSRLASDPKMLEYFRIKRDFHARRHEAPPPAAVVHHIERLKRTLRDYCLRRYQVFYDILFVDADGFVCSTIRHEAEYHTNLFTGATADTALAARLRQEAGEAFIDYEYYPVSDEPSAFIVEPVRDNGELQGWFVLQCSLNKLNRIFRRHQDLLTTGEVFLVNQRHQLLTESRHRPGTGMLERHLSRENIERKFATGRGHMVVVDYRGQRALTSFEVCRIQDTDWLLIAKIDEDEILTHHYHIHCERLRPRLLAALAQPADTAAAPPPEVDATHAIRVDIDEFHLAEDDRALMTFGVNTCTAVLLQGPDHCSCLGHASVYDELYGAGDMDLLGHMLGRIRRFEIYPYQFRELQATVIAPHTRSIARAVDKLLAAGFLLAQIRFVHDPTAVSATVYHDPVGARTAIRWRAPGEDGAVRWQATADCPSLHTILARTIGYTPPEIRTPEPLAERATE
ncbi:MAG: cache domain-containing protein [Planctomycetota bacterium]